MIDLALDIVCVFLAVVAVAVGLLCLGARALRIADDDEDGDE